MCKSLMMCGTDVVKGKGALALLALRLVAGAAFIQHGWPKMQHALAWMGPDSPVPAWLQAVAAFAEFGGGIALLLGLLTQLAALGIACNMLVAMFMVHIPAGDPFVSMGGKSWELAAVYLAIMIALMLRGAGAYSLDAQLCQKK
jgi:putative oxidoreductase